MFIVLILVALAFLGLGVFLAFFQPLFLQPIERLAPDQTKKPSDLALKAEWEAEYLLQRISYEEWQEKLKSL